MSKGGMGVAVVIAACLTACATTVDGTATAPSSAVPSVRIPAGLDTGTASTTGYLPKQGDVDAAWAAEGNRMAEVIALPSDIDPALTFGIKDLTAVPAFNSYKYPALPEEVGPRMVYSKVRVTVARADRATDPTRELRIGLYRFADVKEATDEERMVTYGLKDLRALTVTGAGNAAEVRPGTVVSFRRVNDLWLHVQARAADTAAATAMVERAYARQLPLTTAFRPTPVADLLKLPIDRDGIVTRTLGVAKPTTSDLALIGFLTVPMLERRISDARAMADYRDWGVDLVGWDLGVVARARDPEAAKGYAAARISFYGGATVPGVPQLPDAVQCTDNKVEHQVFCYVTVGRYVARVYGDSAVLARQRAAAQWVILAGAR